MATGPGANQGKTAFAEQFLANNRDADLDAVNEAWRSAGNEGTISESLFGKTRSRLGLTGKRGANGGTTEEAAGPTPSARSSPKGPRGKGASRSEVAPSQPEAREGGAGPAKSAFVEEILGRDPDANVKAINRAWTEAGHEGKISDSIFYKVKRDLGQAGGRAPDEPESAEAPQPEASEPVSAPDAGGAATAPSARDEPGAPGDLGQVVDQVEAGIDDLMFTLKSSGGMPEVEAALRAARRLLTRGQGD